MDYVFIAHYKLGIAGASLSTLISQLLSCMVLISAYFGKHKQLNLIKVLKAQELSVLLPILGNGLPSALRQGLTTLATILLNRAAGMWSDQAVAAISVVNRLFLLAFAFCLGVGQGMMPIVGYLYGSNHLPRARAAYRKAVVLSTLTMLFLALPIWIWARPLMMLFRREEGVLAIGVPALRAQTLVLALHGLMTCTIMALQAIGKKLPATFLASARQGLFFLPLIYLIPLWFGVERVIYVQPVSDVLSFLLTIPFFFYTKQMAEKPKKKNTG